MKPSVALRLVPLWLLLGSFAAGADGLLDHLLGIDVPGSRDEVRVPKLDPKRIINESNGFLLEREPEMTAEEYALYEKMVTMLGTNPEFALKLLEAMMDDKTPPSPAFRFILGNAYYAAGQNDKAETSYRAAVDAYPTFLRAWVNLGILYYATERYADAIPCFSKAVVLGDRDPQTFGLLGFSLEATGNIVSAEMAYMQALGGDPTNPDWKDGLLRIYVAGRQFGRAESLVKNLIADRPKETRYWLTYASILISDQRKLEAIALLETCVRAGVADADELTLLGDLYAEQNMVGEAVAVYAKVFGPAPAVGEKKLLQYARVLTASGRLDQAAAVLAALPAELSADGRLAALQARADLALARKQWPEARQQVEALLAIAPLNGPALLTLGRTYAAEENAPQARFAFEAAARVPATAYLANLELANLELKARHYAETVKYLQQALGIERTDAIETYLARVKTLVPPDEPTT